MWGSRWVRPDSAPTFQRRFTTPNFAWSAAMRMSHAIASSMPPARQYPLIAAMIGFQTSMPLVMPPRFGPSCARRRFRSGDRSEMAFT